MDINADGSDDAASIMFDTPPPTESQVYIQPQQADGELGPAIVVALSTDLGGGCGNISAVTSGDLNGDGGADLVVTRAHCLELVYSTSGTPVAEVIKPLEPGHWYEASPMVFDFDADGHMDIVTHTGMEFYDTMPGDPRSRIRVYFGDGHGGFPRSASFVTGAYQTWDLQRALEITHGDFNSDGFEDLAIAFWQAGGDAPVNAQIFPVKVYLNDRSGGFQTPYKLVDDEMAYKGLAAGDFNGDGRKDLAILFNPNMAIQNTLRIFPQALDGTLSQWSYEFPTYWVGSSLVADDMDLDGDSDIVLAHDGQLRISFNLQNAGKFGESQFVSVSGNSSARFGRNSLAVGDFNNDHCKDALVAATYGGLWLLRGSNCAQ